MESVPYIMDSSELSFSHLEKGDVEYFKAVELEVILHSRDYNGDTLLSKAAISNKFKCCQEIYRRCPSLIFNINSYGNSVLHHAIWYEPTNEFIEFLITAAANTKVIDNEIEGGGLFALKKWLAAQNRQGDTALSHAVTRNNLEVVRLLMDLLVKENYHLELSRIVNDKNFTPLHSAVDQQYLELVELLAVPNPEFEYPSSNDGETPLLMAMRRALPYADYDDHASVRIRKLLLHRQPGQCNVRINEDGWTVLHYAVQKGDIGTIEEILQFCPECMEIADSDGGNFIHTAAKLSQVKVVEYILEFKEISAGILNGTDNEGNTPLHIAAMVGNKKMVLCFLDDPRVNKRILNPKGQRAVDLITTFENDEERAEFYGVRDKVDEKVLKEQSDFDLLVGALIATVSFTAGITVPGGFISDGPNKGTAVLSNSIPFRIFVYSNNLALVLSMYSVFSHFCTRHLLRRADIISQLYVATICTLSAIFALMVAFVTGSYSVFSNSKEIAIPVCVNCFCFFVFAFLALWKMVKQHHHFRALRKKDG